MWNIMLQKQDLFLCVLLPSISQTADKMALNQTSLMIETKCCRSLCFSVGYIILKGLTFGYLESLGQPSMATMILWPARVEACRVSMRIRGIRRSAGVKRWRVDWEKKSKKKRCNNEAVSPDGETQRT